MKTRLEARLNTREINKLIQGVEDFKNELQMKLERFVSELADIGIQVAQNNTYVEVDDVYENMGDALVFTKAFDYTNGATCTLIVTGTPYVKDWKNGKVSVNPLLMAEFGSGWRAIPGHQGTFPGQKYAFRRPWYWIDSNGIKHSSYGSEPSRPLFKAVNEMRNQISTVAERVFN